MPNKTSEQVINRIASFGVDHTVLLPGLYISRLDGDVTTYDLRLCRPNSDKLLPNATLHSVEHLMATLLRNSRLAADVLYFGPMGCQTGFYLLMRHANDADILDLLREILAAAACYEGAMPGASAVECGNYRNLDLACARTCCAEYAAILTDWTPAKMQYIPAK